MYSLCALHDCANALLIEIPIRLDIQNRKFPHTCSCSSLVFLELNETPCFRPCFIFSYILMY